MRFGVFVAEKRGLDCDSGFTSLSLKFGEIFDIGVIMLTALASIVMFHFRHLYG